MLKSLVVVLSMAFLVGCSSKETAEKEARSYLRRMFHTNPTAVNCMDYDTDDNGYVSCDAIVDGRAVSLECSKNLSWNSDCKLRGFASVGPQ